jgi:hypothetical protein
MRPIVLSGLSGSSRPLQGATAGQTLKFILLWLFLGLLATSCTPAIPARETATPTPAPTSTETPVPTATVSLTPSPTPIETLIPTPQPRLTVLPSGPDAENFAPDVNSLTGLRLQDPSMLDLPAVLASISNSPVTARPQAGTSFAAWIYELFIGEGATRFMAAFYGDLPRRIPNATGDCPVNTEIFQPAGALIGNRVWLDENQDGIQDPWEAGVGGICISLIDANGKNVASTSTDSNGYYAFDATTLLINDGYTLEFKIPADYQATISNVGNDDEDSDVDPATGRIPIFYNGKTDSSWDLGLVLVNPPPPTYSPSDIAPERTYVGPIRSGRLTYNDFVNTYPASCLVYASAGAGIRERLEGCEIIYGEQPGLSPNTALLDVAHLKELAQKSKIANQPVNYSSHLFDPAPPTGGLPATSLWVYFHAYAQSFWQYDPVSATYLRQTDDVDGKGVFHSDTDRLTGRQLAFENVVVILADYQVFRHGQYDIALCCGLEGYAFLFRDGQMYKVRWSTNNGVWEQKTGLRRPLHLTGTDKKPFPLKPGRTWVGIMTINSVIEDLKDGKWQALFAMPNDMAPTPEK